jgi:class 3 adenylate cyclase
VLAVNADIRGFTNRMSGDPAVTALYLRSIYSAILRDYFRGAAFFKPTGDGLLIVIPFPEGRRREAISERILGDSIRLVEDFPTLAGDDRLLPRELPTQIGIGLSAGSASRIAVGEVTLDYTGPPLNIASRLMDLARPAGVVADTAVFPDALPHSLRSVFTAEDVYLKGVAESAPLAIQYTADLASIAERYRKPIAPGVAAARPVLPHQTSSGAP